MIGAFLPPRDSGYITLYTLAKGIKKTTIFKGLIENWIVDKRATYSETTLVKEIIQRFNMRWKIEKSQGILSFDQYKKCVKEELTDKGVKDTHIIVILSELRQ